MKSLADRIETGMGPELRGILLAAGSLAAEMGFCAYAVGGMVRALLVRGHPY